MNATIKKLGYIPESIMINVPYDYFCPDYFTRYNIEKVRRDKELAFRRFYETMHTREDACFYHLISVVPAVDTITTVYVCFKGFVQYKAILVKFLKKEVFNLPGFHNECPRNWCVTTGPVVKAPEPIEQRGFRGFRYTQELF